MLPEDTKFSNTKFIHPSSFIHSCKNFIHPAKKHWLKCRLACCPDVPL